MSRHEVSFAMKHSLLVPLALLGSWGTAQVPKHGTLETIQVHCACLTTNLTGDPADRSVVVYLPPSYTQESHRRFPVVYLLHGYKGSGAQWTADTHHGLQIELDQAVETGRIHPLIVVMPDAHTRNGGSFFTDSITNGQWEKFITEALVHEIDRRYRTRASPSSRGIAGHSMGGYGALRIAFDHPEVFSAVYALSPCCLAWKGDFSTSNPEWQTTLSFKSFDAFQSDEHYFAQAFAAMAMAWSPHASAPALYADFPVRRNKAGALDELPAIRNLWTANLLVTLAQTHVARIRRLHAIAFDAGRNDPFTHIPLGEAELDRVLTVEHINHDFELYDGDHTSGIANRITTKMLPFFSNKLQP